MGNWNGHVFEISDQLIRGFTELNINGGCETTEKNTNEQKYVERKYGNARTITLVIGLNALTGVTDVQGEAMQLVEEAEEGAIAYFYMGSRKLVSCQLMLTRADVVEIVTAPGRGNYWISANVRITLTQASDNDGSIPASDSGSGGGGGGGSARKETETASTGTWPPTTKEISSFAVSTAVGIATGNPAAIVSAVTSGVKGAINFVSNAMEKAKTNSATAKGDTPAISKVTTTPLRTALNKNKESTSQYGTAASITAKAKQESNSAQKTNATTGRSQGDKVDAVTMAAPSTSQAVQNTANKVVNVINTILGR